jgi:chaperone required for assembly of F1-ATPase
MVAEKDRMVAEKDKRIEKDKTNAVQDVAVATAQESSDRATALVRIKETYQDRKWGKCMLFIDLSYAQTRFKAPLLVLKHGKH